MVSSVLEPAMSEETPRGVKRYAGRVVYIYAFDVAYEMIRKPVRNCSASRWRNSTSTPAGATPATCSFTARKWSACRRWNGSAPTARCGSSGRVKLLPVGAISITFSVPFEVRSIEDLVAYHDLEFSNGELSQEVRQLAEEARRELAPISSNRSRNWRRRRLTRFFVLTPRWWPRTDRPLSAEDWLHQHRREVAALLTQEPDVNHLSRQEADESTGRYLELLRERSGGGGLGRGA